MITRKLINEKLVLLEAERLAAKDFRTKYKKAKEDQLVAEKALVIMQKAAQLSQEHLAKHLSNIVTQAIQAVIRKPYEFVCEFVERRGSAEADLYLTKKGKQFDILGSTGGGLADVCSFSLKVAYLLLSNVSRTLIIDEVARHINSAEQRQRFAEVLKKLSKEFKIQLILSTAVPELLEIADKTFTLYQKDEITHVISKEAPQKTK